MSMSGAARSLTVDVALATGAARFVVSPPTLAPWTADYFAWFDKPNVAPELSYRLEQTADGARIITPAGQQDCTVFDAPALWDTTLRHVLRYLAGPALLHAALVERDHRATLIVGQSGAGKSTLTNLLCDRGWRYRSDEAVALRTTGAMGLPRCLEFKLGPIPADAAPVWRYAIASNPIAPAFGHRAMILPAAWLPWSSFHCVIALRGRHQEPVNVAPTKLKSREHWLNAPRLRDWRAVRELLRLPCWQISGGPAEVVAERIAAILKNR